MSSSARDVTASMRRFRSEMVSIYAEAPADELHTPPVQLARRLMHQADEAIRELEHPPEVIAAAARLDAVLAVRCEDCGSAGTPTEVERVDHDENGDEIRVPVRALECQCGNLWEVRS